jgi:hypothetical protein
MIDDHSYRRFDQNFGKLSESDDPPLNPKMLLAKDSWVATWHPEGLFGKTKV